MARVPKVHGSPRRRRSPGGGGRRGAEGVAVAAAAGRRLARRSRCGCGAGLPAQSPVTAGEEAAPRLGDGETTLRALFSQAVTMPGCPEPANTRGGEKKKKWLGWCLPAQRGIVRASLPFPSSVGVQICFNRMWGRGSDECCLKHVPYPRLPRGQGVCLQGDVFQPSSMPMGCNPLSLHHQPCPQLLASRF